MPSRTWIRLFGPMLLVLSFIALGAQLASGQEDDGGADQDADLFKKLQRIPGAIPPEFKKGKENKNSLDQDNDDFRHALDPDRQNKKKFPHHLDLEGEQENEQGEGNFFERNHKLQKMMMNNNSMKNPKLNKKQDQPIKLQVPNLLQLDLWLGQHDKPWQRAQQPAARNFLRQLRAQQLKKAQAARSEQSEQEQNQRLERKIDQLEEQRNEKTREFSSPEEQQEQLRMLLKELNRPAHRRGFHRLRFGKNFDVDDRQEGQEQDDNDNDSDLFDQEDDAESEGNGFFDEADDDNKKLDDQDNEQEKKKSQPFDQDDNKDQSY